MRSVRVAVSAMVAFGVVACATTADEDPVEGINEPTVTGFTLSGAVTEIVTNGGGRPFPNIQFNIKVTIANNSASATDISYRTSCPVRMQLHSTGSTPARVYDESRRACGSELSTISVAAGSRATLFSGVRFPRTVLGDSLPPGLYRVVAILERDNAPLAVEAGTYNIPLCETEIGCRPLPGGQGANK